MCSRRRLTSSSRWAHYLHVSSSASSTAKISAKEAPHRFHPLRHHGPPPDGQVAERGEGADGVRDAGDAAKHIQVLEALQPAQPSHTCYK